MSVALAVLVGCCYLPARMVFHPASRRPGLGEALIYTVIGLNALALLSILAARWGRPPELALVAGSALGLAALLRDRGRAWPVLTRPRTALDGLFLALVILSFVTLPLVAYARMGSGSYPRAYFELDNGYYLAQVHSLIQHDEYPPPALDYYGLRQNYHYGVQAMAAIISRVSGLPAHTSLFLVVHPLILLATVAVAVTLTRRLGRGRVPLWLGLVILLLLRPNSVYDILGVTAAFARGDTHVVFDFFLGDPDRYGHAIPILSKLYGLFAALVIFWCMTRVRERGAFLLLAYTVGTLMQFKSPYFLTMGLGLAAWSLVQLLRHRRWRPIAASVAGLGLAVLLMGLLTPGFGGQLGGHMTFQPGNYLAYKLGSHSGFDGISEISGYRLRRNLFRPLDLLPYLVPAAAVICLRRGRRPAPSLWSLSWFAILPYCFVNTFAMTRPTLEGPTYNEDIFQVIALFPHVAGAMLLAYLGANWTLLSTRARRITTAVILAAATPLLLHIWYWGGVVAFIPQDGPVFVDNTPMAEALRTIPLEGTLIVTNELDYRGANDRVRSLLQLQMASIYGHQCYACVLDFGDAASHPEASQRVQEQMRFREPDWDPALKPLARRRGWTHLLIDRTSPHPAAIPVPKVFENRRYAVYQFPW